jgi:hypothetical protein
MENGINRRERREHRGGGQSTLNAIGGFAVSAFAVQKSCSDPVLNQMVAKGVDRGFAEIEEAMG